MIEIDSITDSFQVSLDEAGIRLDKLLATHFPTYSRTYFQSLIDDGCILVNGAILRKREKPQEGDEIEVCFRFPPEIDLQPEAIALEILFEDEHFLAINKPAGMVVHPAPGHPCGTFVNALLHHCQTLSSSDPLRPGIVHRLDKDTSGVLLAAKTPQAHQQLVRLFAERKIEKKYLAICVGTPKEGLIEAPIGRHPVRRKEMAVIEAGGKEAKSVVRVIAKNEALSLIEVLLITGRTHQIRVHMRHLSTPVLGDAIYGVPRANLKFNASRQLLHANSVRLPHPVTCQPIEIQAPPPSDFLAYAHSIAPPKK